MADRIQLTNSLLQQYGPLMGGADLRKAIGYRSAAAFQRAVREKIIDIRVFGIPGRRGKFALTLEVAAWLTVVSNVVDAAILPSTDKSRLENVGEGPNTAEEAEM